MPDWIAVSGAVTSVATMLDLGYRYTPKEAIQGKSPVVVLKEVENILRDTNDLLENHKEILSSEDHKILKAQYKLYYWRMTDEGQQHRAISNETIRRSRILSELYTSDECRRNRAVDLLSTVEAYQTHVLVVTRAATLNEGHVLLDQIVPSIPGDSVVRQQPPSRSSTSWFSAFGQPLRASGSSLDLESGSAVSPPDIVELRSTPEASSTTVGEGS
ncbi:hypothetical protein BDV93DRAFT_567150 [Ceratobasidium sp. AG-I]|nr:hypothetical protein BDV93DRAFT_567150 [Ceratobasidium sp. AG-I]